MRALVITYHGIDGGAPPLSVDPGLLRSHLDALAEVGAHTLTVSELAEGLRCRQLPERAVALTFDDGLASVAAAAPLLAERAMTATVFCVAGRLGSDNRWPTQPPHTPRLALAGPEVIGEWVAQGIEIGSHGTQHAPLSSISPGELDCEVRGSRAALEQEFGIPVRAFAYPYGTEPSPAARALVRATYTCACTTRIAAVGASTEAFSVPRVDAHYLRSPAILSRVATGVLDPYLAARRAGARVRRLLVHDHATARKAA